MQSENLMHIPQHIKRQFFADDGGFSTVGMVLALLLSVSLLIGATQVYKIRSVSAGVQNVADACALAAESQVASFYIVAQVCDSAILSLSVAGVATLGIGVVAACVPAGQELSIKLVEAGHNILKTRTRFAESCANGLNKLQGLLPIFAALSAASVGQANNDNTSAYYALALLCPLEGSDIEISLPESEEETLDALEDEREKIAKAAQEAEEAAQAANEHKRAAYMADCGNAPGYCMYERAAKLAGLGGSYNPHYASVDTWSFSVALARAKAYYPRRLAQEAPATAAVDEQARSAIRRHFYAYAVEEMSTAYVRETDDVFECYFPLLPRNTQEMRESALYTQEVYPLTTAEDGGLHMHAWSACPQAVAEASAGVASVAFMEAHGLEQCPVCEFSATSVGKVAAASTSIENGFEYHYHIVAREAAAYMQEHQRLSQHSQAVKKPAEGLFQTLKNILNDSLNCRIRVFPPGRQGAVALVVDTQGIAPADIVASPLVASHSSLGPRLAISAASLSDDDANEADTVISSLLDDVFQQTQVLQGPSAVLDVWSGFLQMYSKGHQTLSDSIKTALNAVPLVGAAGLGTWASKRFQETIEAAGFAPPDLVSHKPVLVNTYHVASADQNSFSQGLLSAKEAVSSAYGGIAQDPMAAVVGIAAGKLLSTYEAWDATFVIARIELLGEGGPSVPIEITLPPAIKEAGMGFIEAAIDSLLAGFGHISGVTRWE